jgi:Flp pilus assembly pilin Flp
MLFQRALEARRAKLIAAGISVAIITVVNSLGGQLKNTFNTVSTQLGTAGK